MRHGRNVGAIRPGIWTTMVNVLRAGIGKVDGIQE